jgi:hypothetical protein
LSRKDPNSISVALDGLDGDWQEISAQIAAVSGRPAHRI